MMMEPYNPPQEPGWSSSIRMSILWSSTSPAACCRSRERLDEHKDSVMTRIQRDFPQAESVHRPGYGDQRCDCGGAHQSRRA